MTAQNRNVFSTPLTRALLSFSLLALPQLAFSHEGDHGPSSVEAPHGGAMRSLETIHLELIQDKDHIKIYLYSKDLKPKAVKDIPISAKLSLPKEKSVPFKLKEEGNFWEGTYTGKDTHRYTIQLEVKQGGHVDKLEFTIERKK